MKYMDETFFSLDISETLRAYDYTKRSRADLRLITSSVQFQEDDSETIFYYLKDQMEIVFFGDFLKRYLYETFQLPGAFSDVSEETYLSCLSDNFAMNRAPHAFTEVRSKWRNTLKRWLSAEYVRRDTVFLLGFGLNMTDRDVSLFLTKVIKEQDFRFSDPREAVFYYCYHHGLSYAEALTLLHPSEPPKNLSSFWPSVQDQLKVYLSNREMLIEYLSYLRESGPDPEDILFDAFFSLYSSCVEISRGMLNDRQENVLSSDLTSGASDIERVLYSGIRRTKKNNLLPETRSVFRKMFRSCRLDRQHLSRLLSKKTRVSRFDLLTLLFLRISTEDETHSLTKDAGSYGKERFLRFINEANSLLTSCNLWEFYPANPYESFLMMCLLTEDPVCAYNDVWEMSYEL